MLNIRADKMKYEPKEYWNGRGKSFLEGLYFPRSSERFKTYFLYNPILKHLLRKEIKRLKPRTLLENVFIPKIKRGRSSI